MNTPKIIMVSHTFPPTVGGVETQNYELSNWLGQLTPITLIANRRGRKFLPFFAPYSLLKTLWLLPKHDVVLLGSGMLAINGWFIKLFSNKPVVSVVHGLDINYNSSSLGVWYEKALIFIYQTLWTKIFIPKLDKLIAVGNETIKIGVEHGIPENKFIFIPNGVNTEKHLIEATRQNIEEIIQKSIGDKNIIITTGRLAKRKGVAWFISNVLPLLDEKFIYIVAGSGPDKENIQNAIQKSDMSKRVFMLGYISDENRNLLWNSADLFVQPNIRVSGDLEGFGISVIEAGACRLPVLASNMEGLKDAIKDGKNGFLIESENADAYAQKINRLFKDGSPREIYGEGVRQFVIENYKWEKIAQIYLKEIKRTLER
ncbi:MAG: Glycosyl transferase, group 1 family [uncultured bacterium]|nr:MAG: Glycosyl transferase, group 1 family [uncultured bacterium]